MSSMPAAAEHLGLADLRAADAGRAALDLPPRDRRRFVGFRVRSQRYACSVRELLDAADISEETRAVDQDLRSGNIGYEHRVIG